MEIFIKLFVHILCTAIGSFIGCIAGIYFVCGKKTAIDIIKDIFHFNKDK